MFLLRLKCVMGVSTIILNKQYEIAVVILGSTFHRGIHRLSFVHSFLDICCGTGALGLCLAQVW